MKPLKKNHARICVFFSYTILFSIICLTIFSSFIICNKTFVWDADGYLQHFPILQKVRSLCASLLHGEGISFWSWDIGLGADTIGNLFQVLFDPFEYIAAAFPTKYLDIGYSVSIILRLYTAGITFLIFSRGMHFQSNTALMGSIGYAFCTWMIGSAMHQSTFLMPAILFPLLVLGIEYYFNNRSPVLFIISVAWIIVSSVYFAYMTAIGSSIYILIRYFFLKTSYKKNLLNFFKIHIKLILYAVVSALLSLVIICPTVYTLMNASKVSNTSLSFFHTLKSYLLYFPSMISNSTVFENYSYIGFPALFIIFIPIIIYLCKTKNGTVSMIMSIIFFIMVLFPVFGSIFNGFSYPVGRWCYMLSFFFLVSCQEIIDYKLEYISTSTFFKLSMVWLIILAIWIVLFCNIITHILNGTNTLISLVTIIIGLLCILVFTKIPSSDIFKNCKTPQTLLTLLVLNIIITYGAYYSPLTDELSSYTTRGELYSKLMASPQKAGQDIEDDSFYRIDQADNSNQYSPAHTPVNENIFFGNRSIYTYFSTTSNLWFDFNNAVGNNAGYYRRMCSYSNDNRTRLDFLLGVKYFLGNNEKTGRVTSQYASYGFEPYTNINGTEVLKNKHSIGLGAIYGACVKESEFYRLESLAREQILMQAAVVSDELYATLPSKNQKDITDLIIQIDNIPYTISDENNVTFSNDMIIASEDNATFSINIGDITDSEIYVVFENLSRQKISLKDEIYSSLDRNAPDYKLNLIRQIINNISYKDYGDFNILAETGDITKKALNPLNESQSFPDITDFNINMGYYDHFNGNIKITLSKKGTYSFDSIKVIAVPIDNFDKQAEILETKKYDITDFSDNYVKGTVSSENGGLLYLSILYNDGWKVYVDGAEIDPIKINVGFTGIPVSAGVHTVELKYKPVGFNFGISGFIIGLIILVLTTIRFYPPRKI